MSSNPLSNPLEADVVEVPGFLLNRTKPHLGMTARRGKDIGLSYDAELQDIGYMEKFNNLILCCSEYDLSRSYLYVRENSIEFNYALNYCFFIDLPLLSCDNIKVQYFDRNPYTKGCQIVHMKLPLQYLCCPFIPGIPLCTWQEPKLEVFDPAIMCCNKKLDYCCPKQVVFMPFETMPFPCCCCSNRYECSSCYGVCGPIAGSPIIYVIPKYFPQPSDANEFINQLRVVSPESK